MNSKYICTECDRKIPWEEYLSQSDLFCSECGGHIEEAATDLASKKTVNRLSEAKNTSTATTTIKSLLISCESCSHQFSKRAESCPKCGWKPKVMCQICRQQIPFDSTVCSECGDPVPFSRAHVKEQETNESTLSTSFYSKLNSEHQVNTTNATPSNFNLSWFLFSFDGRIGRQSFWYAYLIILFLSLIISVALELVEESKNMNGLLILVILMLLLLWPSYAIQVKRWHDRNKSGNWVLLNFIPIIGFLWVAIELGFLKGTEGDNNYGKNPLSS